MGDVDEIPSGAARPDLKADDEGRDDVAASTIMTGTDEGAASPAMKRGLPGGSEDRPARGGARRRASLHCTSEVGERIL